MDLQPTVETTPFLAMRHGRCFEPRAARSPKAGQPFPRTLASSQGRGRGEGHRANLVPGLFASLGTTALLVLVAPLTGAEPPTAVWVFLMFTPSGAAHDEGWPAQ